MIALLLGGVIAQSTAPLPPPGPYVRVKTLAREVSSEVCAGDQLYFKENERLKRFDLPEKEIWTNSTPQAKTIVSLVAHPRWVIASTGQFGRPGSIVAFQREDGKAGWSLPVAQTMTEVVLNSDRVFLSAKPGEVSAFDIANRKAAWTTRLEGDEAAVDGRADEQYAVLATTSDNLKCFDAKSGKLIWTKPLGEYSSGEWFISSGVVTFESGGDLSGVDLATGNVLWTQPEKSAFAYAATPEGFVALDSDVRYMDAKTGEVKWSYPLGNPDEWTNGDSIAIDGNRIKVNRLAVTYIYDFAGKELWRAPEGTYFGSVHWTDGKTVVTGQYQIMVLKPGSYPALPADPKERQALASNLAKSLLDLSPEEVKRLISLGDDAFPAVLEEYLRIQALADTGIAPRSSLKAGYPLGQILTDLAGPQHSEIFIDLKKRLSAGSAALNLIDALYAKHVDPKVTIPGFLETLKAQELKESLDADGNLALETVAASNLPQAVEYLIAALKNPKVNNEIRNEAYTRLGAHGPDARAAVLAQRRTKVENLPTLEQRMNLRSVSDRAANADSRLVAEHRDSLGRSWGLVVNSVLGNRSDLFLVEKVDGVWQNPVFTGLSLNPPSTWAENAVEAKLDGKTGAELVKSGWEKAIIGRAEILADQDRDGYTDLVEKRLNTDPAKADTDGDGKRDSEDAFPATASRTMTNEERILAVAFEAHYRFRSWSKNYSPALLDMGSYRKPFELPGWQGPIIWGNIDNRSLGAGYEYGTAMLRCEVVKNEGDSATVELSTYFGGLAGEGWKIDLRRFEGEWFVVQQIMQYVS